ncbi:hypothetical protein DFH06DRAFT_1481566 [Mycena polygramma]|nr:hypothetical protein DFH06DRAFT_1481566 [Mycena polygramma]
MPLSILDLPTELLLAIFTETDLPSQDVYSLALVCRRLHFTALPVYFSRHGLRSGTRSIQITIRTDRRDLLAALRIALFDTPLDHISFVFTHPDPYSTTASVTPLLEQFRRVEGFLSDFTAIQLVSLDLARHHVSYPSVGSDELLRTWAKGFGDLLNCIAQTRCTALTVLHGDHFVAYELFQVKPASWMSRLISWVYPASAQQPPEFQRVSQQGVVYVAIVLPHHLSRASHLTCIHIHSATLILPPGLSWTLGVLRNCPISKLTFSKISVRQSVWEIVLPLIASAAPGLTSVRFFNLYHFPEPGVMAFLALLPRLVDLDISFPDNCLRVGLYFVRPGQRPPPPPYLPCLTHLRIEPSLLSSIFSHNNSIRALETVTVVFHPLITVERTAEMIPRILSLVNTHCPSTPAPLLGLATTRSSYVLDSPSGNMTPELSASLDHVQRFEVDWDISFDAVEKAIRGIVLRVAAFRRVKSVAIKLEPEADVGDLPQRLASSIARTEFLQVIEVNGREYPLVRGDRR